MTFKKSNQNLFIILFPKLYNFTYRTLRMISFYEDLSIPFEQENYQTNFRETKEEDRSANVGSPRHPPQDPRQPPPQDPRHPPPPQDPRQPPPQDPEIRQTILREIQRRLPLLLTSKLTRYIEKFNKISRTHHTDGDQQTTASPAPTTSTTTTASPPPSTTTTTRSTTARPVTYRSFYTYRSDAVPSAEESDSSLETPRYTSLQRPQPTPFDQIRINDLRHSFKAEGQSLNRLLQRVSQESTFSENDIPGEAKQKVYH